MKKLVEPCKCGSKEFITAPNRYDILEIIDGKLEYISSHSTNDEEKYFCRECGKEIELRSL